MVTTACSQLQLSTDHDSRASVWKFKKLEKVDSDPQPVCLLLWLLWYRIGRIVFKPDPLKQFVAAPVKRPTQLDSAIKDTFAVTIPAGWITTITSVSQNLLLSKFSNSVVERSPTEIALILSEFAALSMGRWRKKIVSVVGILLIRQWRSTEAIQIPWLCLPRRMLMSLSSRLSTLVIGRGRTHASCLGSKIQAQTYASSRYIPAMITPSFVCLLMLRLLGQIPWKVSLTFRLLR